MIKGIGIDSVEKDRVSKIFSKYGERFQNKILSPNEKKDCLLYTSPSPRDPE